MLEETVADILRDLNWIDMNDERPATDGGRLKCDGTRNHVYCVVRSEVVFHHHIETGTLLRRGIVLYEVCFVDSLTIGEAHKPEVWLIIYFHEYRTDDAESTMTEDEWYELYGDPDLASRGGLDTGSNRDDRHSVRDGGEVATRKR